MSYILYKNQYCFSAQGCAGVLIFSADLGMKYPCKYSKIKRV